MRTAIVHYWLLNSRGGEAVLEGLCRLLPDADLFTLFYDPRAVRPALRAHRIHVSFLNPLRRWYRSLLPLMPLALEQFDLSGYDLVISSESGPAKGVLVPSRAHHVCYCHTPLRYLWELYPQYVHDFTRSRTKRALMAPLASYLRTWDFATSARVDDFIANSDNVRQRIWRAYRRHAEVIYPPVPVETFRWGEADDYYLVVAELVAYKRIDQAVRVFSKTGRRLRIVGDGPEYRRLRGMAARSVEFCGRVSDGALREIYARCRALVVPGEEDFGITPVEAMASGKPVIALGRGGVTESVSHECGILYSEPDDAHLREAVERFEKSAARFRAEDLQRRAARFSEAEFARKMSAFLAGASPAVLTPEHHGQRA
jgi:glycosyltransferase involved in cell wall biosynthesis